MGELTQAQRDSIARATQQAARMAAIERAVQSQPPAPQPQPAPMARGIEPQLAGAQRNAISSMALANPNPPSAGVMPRQMSAVSPPPPVAPPAQTGQVSTLEDVLRSGAAGIGRGVAGIVGLPGTVDDLITYGMERAGIMPSADDMAAQGATPGMIEAATRGNPMSGQALTEYMGDATGGATDYRGQTLQGQYAGTIGEFLPGGAIARMPMIAGVVPGAASEFAGQMTEGTRAEPYARFGAALISPTITQGLTNPGAVARAMYGTGAPSAERTAAANLLESRGVPLTAGQRIGNEATLRREMLTETGRRLGEEQREAFTSAILSTIGENARRATTEVLDAASTRIGKAFDDVQRGVDITPDPALVSTVRQIATDYAESVASQSPIVGNIVSRMDEALQANATIPATELTRWRRIMNGMSRSPDEATRDAAIAMREALDDGLNQTLAALGRSDDIARLAEARGQWRNYLAIVRGATAAGEASEGILSPSIMRNAVAGQDRAAYATGNRGEIADITRAGDTLLRPPPNSGTPAGWSAISPPQVMSGMAGATVGGALDLSTLGVGAATLLGAGGPALYRSMGMTGPVQNALRNTSGPPLLMPESVNALAGLFAQ